MHKFLFYNKFIIFLYMFRALCAHHQEFKIVLYSTWYHHTCRWPSGAQVQRRDTSFAEANDVSFLQNVQTGYGARLSPYSVDREGVRHTNSCLATRPRIFRAVTQLSLHACMACVGKTAFAVIRRAYYREPVVQW